MKKAITPPEVARQNGMTRLVFEDDFDSYDTIDMTGEGNYGYKWYLARAFRARPLTPDDFRVENSILYLEEHDSLYNYGLATYNPRTNVGFSFNKGVLEFRIRVPHYDAALMKYDEPDCGGPAIWSFPPEKIRDTALEWVEMDWMEYWGTYDGRFPDGYWTTTLHHEKRVDAESKIHFLANNTERQGAGKLGDGQWHTLTFLWDEGFIDSWIDGEQSVRVTYRDNRPEPTPKVQMGDPDTKGIYTPMDSQYLALIINGAKNNPLEIDWIRVWQH